VSYPHQFSKVKTAHVLLSIKSAIHLRLIVAEYNFESPLIHDVQRAMIYRTVL